ncbi:hypothetical protein Tco_0503926 [Tanacetum coccineum]
MLSDKCCMSAELEMGGRLKLGLCLRANLPRTNNPFSSVHQMKTAWVKSSYLLAITALVVFDETLDLLSMIFKLREAFVKKFPPAAGVQ